MSKDGIDASLGLSFSLELFKRYQKDGVLQAELPRMPGLQGRCMAYLQLVNGLVVSVYVEDKQGRRYSSDKETLCRLDTEKGPYEWKLISPSIASQQTNPAGQFQGSSPHALAASLQRTSIPRVISSLPWERLNGWSPQQRDALYVVLATIDGMHTVEEITHMVYLPIALVEELLLILLELNVIAIYAR